MPDLSVHPNQSIADELKNGCRTGFTFIMRALKIFTILTNLISIKVHPKVVKEKVDKEIAMGRILVAGPSNKEPLGNLRLSPIWNVAKKDGL